MKRIILVFLLLCMGVVVEAASSVTNYNTTPVTQINGTALKVTPYGYPMVGIYPAATPTPVAVQVDSSGAVVISGGVSPAPPSGRSVVQLARNVYSSTNVTTSAYVQLIASTSDTTNEILVFDSSGQTLVFAVGAASSEVNQFYITPGMGGVIDLAIPAGSRVSLKAVSATANTGELDVTLLK